MDKNDFDIDFDFDKEYGLDEDDLSGQAGDDTQAAGQDFGVEGVDRRVDRRGLH